VWSRHSFYWCAVSISICRRPRTARLPFQRQARAVSFGPTNYEECLHRSEWVSEWVTHLHIGVPITNFVSTLRVTTRLKNRLLNRIKPFLPWCTLCFSLRLLQFNLGRVTATKHYQAVYKGSRTVLHVYDVDKGELLATETRPDRKICTPNNKSIKLQSYMSMHVCPKMKTMLIILCEANFPNLLYVKSVSFRIYEFLFSHLLRIMVLVHFTFVILIILHGCSFIFLFFKCVYFRGTFKVEALQSYHFPPFLCARPNIKCRLNLRQKFHLPAIGDETCFVPRGVGIFTGRNILWLIVAVLIIANQT